MTTGTLLRVDGPHMKVRAVCTSKYNILKLHCNIKERNNDQNRYS
jgi:hypothetical protein